MTALASIASRHFFWAHVNYTVFVVQDYEVVPFPIPIILLIDLQLLATL